MYRTRVKIQGVLVAIEIYRFVDGEVDVRLDRSNVVSVYRHEISITPGAANLSKVRAILTRGDQGRAEDGHEVLCGDNWSMTSTGMVLSLRFSGRHPADAAGRISEPAQPTVDVTAESGVGALEFVKCMKAIDKCREDAEAAALEHSEFTYEDRKELREKEAAEREEREERSRPQRLWNAVKEGKSKAVTEVIDKPYVRTQPPKPLITLADDAGWTLLHWAAFKNHREVCTVLLRYHADITARDFTGSIPLHLASSNGSEEACLFLLERMTKHEASWALNAANNFGSTPLVEASSNGHHTLAEKLYKAKCDWHPNKDPSEGTAKLPHGSSKDTHKADRRRTLTVDDT